MASVASKFNVVQVGVNFVIPNIKNSNEKNKNEGEYLKK